MWTCQVAEHRYNQIYSTVVEDLHDHHSLCEISWIKKGYNDPDVQPLTTVMTSYMSQSDVYTKVLFTWMEQVDNNVPDTAVTSVRA